MKKIMILFSLTFIFAQDPISLTGEMSGIGLDSKPPQLEWIYPNNGEYFEASENINIQWSFTEDSPVENGIMLKLIDSENYILEEIMLNEVIEYSIILPDVINTTAYFELTLIDGFGYINTIQSESIYIGFINPISVSAELNGFTLDSQKPLVSVISPNGGESYTIDETMSITWEALDEELDDNSVLLLLSLNNGYSFDEILSNIENTGFINVDIPDELTSEGLIKIKITDLYGNVGEDISDNIFELLPIEDIQFSTELQFILLDSKSPIVEWLSPNNGGILPSGESIETEWLATDDSFSEMPVNIDINENGIAISSFPNQSTSGIHDITLPEITAENISFTVTAIDDFGNTATDESDNLFTLKKFGCTDETANNFNELAEIDDDSCIYTTSMDMSVGNNLISLPGALFNTNTQEFLEMLETQCESEINFILGQGVGLFKLDDGWSGNLTALNNTSGYWLNSNSSCEFEYEINGFSDECLTYDLSGGNNLVSYAGIDNTETVEALGGEVLSGLFTFILGQGQGLFATENGWSGNLTTLQHKKGYWLNSNIPNPNFQWGMECESENTIVKEITENASLDEFQFEQSTEQAFYLIEAITIDNQEPTEDDIILAYNGNVLVGSAKYNENMTVLPIMGRDVSEQTMGFLEEGEIPQLKLYQSSTCAMIDLQADLDGFRNLLVSEVESVTGNTIIIPKDFALHPAYPNPFNPVTTIQFGVPSGTLNAISIEIFDINGRHIETLINGEVEPGNHSIQWDATGLSSGVYFVKMSMDPSKSLEQGFIQTQKLILMK